MRGRIGKSASQRLATLQAQAELDAYLASEAERERLEREFRDYVRKKMEEVRTV